MEWFRTTYDGPQEPIRDMIREDYEEPTEPIDLIKLYQQGRTMKSLPELMAQLDCYVGHVDGYAYRSYDRLMRMRKKGVFKPKGPLDIYQYPGTDAMKTGWFLNDERLKRTNWHRTVTEFRKIPTDVTRFYKEALLIDRCFKI